MFYILMMLAEPRHGCAEMLEVAVLRGERARLRDETEAGVMRIGDESVTT
jgi:hypothetical protein